MTDVPAWFSRIDISACKEYFEEVERFADESGRKEQFLRRLKRLVWGDKSDEELTVWERPAKARLRLYKDFAPHSFEFVLEVMYADESDWTFQFNGGIIFHGDPHNSGGGFPTLAVNVEPQDGWSVHT